MATYTFKKGDSLLAIAKQFGVSYDSLLAANPGVRSPQAGVTLRVPTVTTQAGRPPPPGARPIATRPQPPRQPTQQPPRLGRRPTPVRPPGPIAPTPPPIQPQTPVVRFTGAQPPPDIPAVRFTGAQPAPPPPQRQALIPGAFQVGQAIAPSVQNFLDRLFRRPLPAQRRPGEPTAGARFAPVVAQETIASGLQDIGRTLSTRQAAVRAAAEGVDFAEGFPRGSLAAPGPGAVLTAAGEALGGGPSARGSRARRAVAESEAEIDVELGHITYRMMLADGTVGRSNIYSMSSEDVGPDGRLTDEAIEKYEDQRAEHVGMSLLRRQKPQVIFEHDRRANGISRERMLEMGYFWNEKIDAWEYGQPIEEAPQSYGVAMPYGGYGYVGQPYSYPRGGGGTFSPYKGYENYVEGAKRGRVPQQIQNRPARFGAVTWRI